MTKIRIYIVEDESLIAMDICDRLTQLDYEVCGRAARGERALEDIPELKPDLVLMDIKLAGDLTGVETAARLHQTLDLPVVFLSAFSDDQLVKEAIGTGAYGFLVKPFEERELHATLQATLYKHRAEQLLRSDKARLEAAVGERTAELQRSEAALRDIFDGTSDLIQSVDAAGRITFVNAAWRNTLGYTSEEIAQLSVFSVIHPDCLAHCREVFARLMAGEDVGLVEITFATKQGVPVTVEGRVSTRVENGRITQTRGIFRDVTERKAAEKALRDSEENLAVTLNSIGDAVVATDASGRITRFNPVAEELTGWMHHEAVGRPIEEVFNIVREDTGAPASIPVAETIAQGTTHGLANHTILLARDGTKRPIADSCAPIRDRENRVIGAVLVFRDVTKEQADQRALEASEQALRELNENLEHLVTERTAKLVISERRLNHALESTSDGIWDWNIHSGEFYFSPQSIRLMQLDPDSPPASMDEFLALVHPDDQARMQQAQNDHLAGRSPAMSVEVQLRTGTGQYRWFQNRGKVMTRFDTEAPLRMVGTIADITERKHTEQALKDNEEMFRNIFEHSPVPIILTQLPEGVIVDANAAAVHTFGFSRTQLVGQQAPGWIEPLDRERFMSELRSRGLVENFKTAFRRPDGRTLHTLLYSNTVSLRGRQHAITTLLDITRQLEAEEVQRLAEGRLRQQQKIESIGALAGGIAHDFNNILSAIITHVDLLRVDLPPDADSREDVECISSAADRARHLVHQILTFSRQSEGEMEPTSLDTVITEVRKLLRATLPAMVRLDYQTAPDCPLVMSNATQIHQVVMNLCTNAWHAMPEQGGRIALKLEACTITQSQAEKLPPLEPGRHVRLTVTDDGSGMDETTLARIFDPFFTTKRSGEGTGLGLSVVHTIIANHHGAITVRSTPGLGTTFELYFPALEGQKKPARNAATPSATASTASFRTQSKLLLVDDEPVVGSALEKLLTREGHHVTRCVSPETALSICREQADPFDLVITDQSMPEMTGLDLAVAIHEILPRVPIIIQSGYISPTLTNAVGHHGIEVILQKPVLSRKLCDLVNSCLVKAQGTDTATPA